MSDNFHLSSDIICPEAFNDVVQELGSDGTELLAAVQEDDTVFGKNFHVSKFPISNTRKSSNCPIHIPVPMIIHSKNSIKNEPPEYNEDQKTFINNWNGNQQYEYNDHSVIYPNQPALQQPIGQIPANVDYAGDLDFDILISSHTANRNSWIYSSVLKKVFINMQNVLPIDVKRNPTNIDLYLRATLLYSLPQYSQEIVERCSTHVDPRMSTNRDVNVMVMKHVLRCNNHGSMYVGDTDLKQHLSVITPLELPQAGMDTVRVNYQFMCKNSCPSGMNRRAVDVIFTLEDRLGNVLGRRKLAVRVCSCPKRDKEKEEKEFCESNQQTPTHTRKRRHATLKAKIESNPVPDDDSLYEIPSIRIVGRQRAERILLFLRNELFFGLSNESFDENKQEKSRESFEIINNVLKTLSPTED